MLVAILLIIFAWVIEMPIWLSVLTTVIGGILFIARVITFAIKVAKLYAEDHNE